MSVMLAAAMIIGEEPVRETSGPGGPVPVSLGHGYDHPRHSSMQVGGPGEERHGRLLWIGWVFGTLHLVLMISCLLVGMSKKGNPGPTRWPLISGGLILVSLLTLLFATYDTYMSDGRPGALWNLPDPTSLMIFGIWIFPLLIVAYFVLTFDRWYLRSEDLDRFREIVAKYRGGQG